MTGDDQKSDNLKSALSVETGASPFAGYVRLPMSAPSGKQEKAPHSGFYLSNNGKSLYYFKKSLDERFQGDDISEVFCSDLIQAMGDTYTSFAKCHFVENPIDKSELYVASLVTDDYQEGVPLNHYFSDIKTQYIVQKDKFLDLRHELSSEDYFSYPSDEDLLKKSASETLVDSSDGLSFSQLTHGFIETAEISQYESDKLIRSLSSNKKSQLAAIIAMSLFVGDQDCQSGNIGENARGRLIKIDHGWAFHKILRNSASAHSWLTNSDYLSWSNGRKNPSNHFRDYKSLIYSETFVHALNAFYKKNALLDFNKIVKANIESMLAKTGDSPPLRFKALTAFSQHVGLKVPVSLDALSYQDLENKNKLLFDLLVVKLGSCLQSRCEMLNEIAQWLKIELVLQKASNQSGSNKPHVSPVEYFQIFSEFTIHLSSKSTRETSGKGDNHYIQLDEISPIPNGVGALVVFLKNLNLSISNLRNINDAKSLLKTLDTFKNLKLKISRSSEIHELITRIEESVHKKYPTTRSFPKVEQSVLDESEIGLNDPLAHKIGQLPPRGGAASFYSGKISGNIVCAGDKPSGVEPGQLFYVRDKKYAQALESVCLKITQDPKLIPSGSTLDKIVHKVYLQYLEKCENEIPQIQPVSIDDFKEGYLPEAFQFLKINPDPFDKEKLRLLEFEFSKNPVLAAIYYHMLDDDKFYTSPDVQKPAKWLIKLDFNDYGAFDRVYPMSIRITKGNTVKKQIRHNLSHQLLKLILKTEGGRQAHDRFKARYDTLKNDRTKAKALVLKEHYELNGDMESFVMTRNPQGLYQAKKKALNLKAKFTIFFYTVGRFLKGLQYSESKGAVKEVVSNDHAISAGLESQSSEVIEGSWIYRESGVPKKMVCCKWEKSFRTFEELGEKPSEVIGGMTQLQFAGNGESLEKSSYLCGINKEGKVCSASHLVTDLGQQYALFLRYGDRDAIGKAGQNKGVIPDKSNPGKFKLFGIDFGKCWENTGLLKSLSEDFSFQDPKREMVNYAMFEDTHYIDKMKGIHVLAKQCELSLSTHESILDEIDIELATLTEQYQKTRVITSLISMYQLKSRIDELNVRRASILSSMEKVRTLLARIPVSTKQDFKEIWENRKITDPTAAFYQQIITYRESIESRKHKLSELEDIILSSKNMKKSEVIKLLKEKALLKNEIKTQSSLKQEVIKLWEKSMANDLDMLDVFQNRVTHSKDALYIQDGLEKLICLSASVHSIDRSVHLNHIRVPAEDRVAVQLVEGGYTASNPSLILSFMPSFREPGDKLAARLKAYFEKSGVDVQLVMHNAKEGRFHLHLRSATHKHDPNLSLEENQARLMKFIAPLLDEVNIAKSHPNLKEVAPLLLDRPIDSMPIPDEIPYVPLTPHIEVPERGGDHFRSDTKSVSPSSLPVAPIADKPKVFTLQPLKPEISDSQENRLEVSIQSGKKSIISTSISPSSISTSAQTKTKEPLSPGMVHQPLLFSNPLRQMNTLSGQIDLSLWENLKMYSKNQYSTQQNSKISVQENRFLMNNNLLVEYAPFSGSLTVSGQVKDPKSEEDVRFLLGAVQNEGPNCVCTISPKSSPKSILKLIVALESIKTQPVEVVITNFHQITQLCQNEWRSALDKTSWKNGVALTEAESTCLKRLLKKPVLKPR